ncbi:hypothetical protein KC19_3G104300 [Ceratodon purpureus]|uniref:Pathogen-related protein n=1 Tax=Ceratodon purpureus TaxID=3225 RepID=A0A8T0IIA8_CERPU|nr:hypothetical protein KC19_3G104300 [Ceratodon purpureus]
MANLAESVAQVSLKDSSEGHGVEGVGDPYRDHLSGSAEKDTIWRHGNAPRYEQVNALFESGRTQVWPTGSLEETVQNLVKTWEMELSHKTKVTDFKTIDQEKFCISVNGGPKFSATETLQVGSYNALLATSSFQGDNAIYQSSKETFESSHDIFRTVFPGGFAWEVQAVYSPPPVVVMKYRHWGVMEGAYKGHAPTGEVVDSVGIVVAKVDENLKILELEVYYDTAAFLGGLTKGPKSEGYTSYQKGVEGCPYLNHGRLQ